VAVLAFEDLGSERDRAWLADQVSEEILHELGGIEGISVIARQSSFAFHGTPVDADSVAGVLGVDYLVSGGVEQVADSIRITARLIDPGTGRELWGGTYVRVAAAWSSSGVQGDVARGIARALQLRLRPASPPAADGPDDQAYEAYLEGRYHLRRFQSGASDSPETLLQSLAYFQDVVRRTPLWAPGSTCSSTTTGPGAARSGDGEPDVPLYGVDEILQAFPRLATHQEEAILALQEALERLENESERHARIIECRFFGGMTIEETAEALRVSPATVKRGAAVARAWLGRELEGLDGSTEVPA
jgi:RNA polymerase sigma factor (sigma-70 family)